MVLEERNEGIRWLAAAGDPRSLPRRQVGFALIDKTGRECPCELAQRILCKGCVISALLTGRDAMRGVMKIIVSLRREEGGACITRME